MRANHGLVAALLAGLVTAGPSSAQADGDLLAPFRSVVVSCPEIAGSRLDGWLEARRRDGGVPLKFGFRTERAPFAFASGHQDDTKDAAASRPSGFTVAICHKIRETIEKCTKHASPLFASDYFTKVRIRDRFDLLDKPRSADQRYIDLHCGPTTQLDIRERIVDFSRRYFVSASVGVTTLGADQALRTRADLVGKTIATVSRSSSRTILDQFKDDFGYRVLPTSNLDATLDCLGQGNPPCDIAVADQEILLFRIYERHLHPQLAMTRRHFSPEPYALPIRQDDDILRAYADATISALLAQPDVLEDAFAMAVRASAEHSRMGETQAALVEQVLLSRHAIDGRRRAWRALATPARFEQPADIAPAGG